MKRAAKGLAGALLFVLLAGCATSRCPLLAPDVSYCLQPPAAGAALASLQEVVVTKGDRVERLLVQTENGPARLVVVGVSPLGQTLVSATWDGTDVQVHVAVPSMVPDAGSMLAFAQFGMLPFEALGAGFAADLVRTSEAREDGATFRLRDTVGRPLLEIRRDGHRPPFAATRIRLPDLGLDVQSRTLDPATSVSATP